MEKCLDSKSRRKLENKLLTVLSESIQPLSKEFQMLLVDDLVTAFENRFKVLTLAQTQVECYVETPSEINPQLI